MTRAEAIEWLEYHIAITDYDKDDDLLKALKYAVRELKAEPVKHGRWIWKDHYLVCSECGEENDRKNYCPNCGAKMDLDEVGE